MSVILDQSRLSRAKRAFSTRRMNQADFQVLLEAEDLAGYTFQSGDLALARVDNIGHHKRVERPDGRRARLFEGDEIIVAIGARYAPDQYEALVPTHLGPCHLAAAGGVAGRIVEMHDRIIRPTEITLLGLIGSRRKRPLNLTDAALAPCAITPDIPAIVVAGTSMNSGKTTTAAGLVHGLSAAGRRVGAIKVTGTGAGGDFWHFTDAGATQVLDFTDAGYVSTYLQTEEALDMITATLMGELAAKGCDVAVIEVADGLGLGETADLLRRPLMRRVAPKALYAAREAAGAVHGVEWLINHGYDVIGVSGQISRSPLTMREYENMADTPCLSFETLCDPAFASGLLQPQQPDTDIQFCTAS
ncbi:MAG: hypothetical protein ACPGGK_06535 [Pikeienuella sp.]